MNAWMMKFIIDAIENKDQSVISLVPMVIVGIVLIRGTGSFLGNYYLAKVSNSIVHTLRCQIFDRLYSVADTIF